MNTMASNMDGGARNVIQLIQYATDRFTREEWEKDWGAPYFTAILADVLMCDGDRQDANKVQFFIRRNKLEVTKRPGWLRSHDDGTIADPLDWYTPFPEENDRNGRRCHFVMNMLARKFAHWLHEKAVSENSHNDMYYNDQGLEFGGKIFGGRISQQEISSWLIPRFVAPHFIPDPGSV